MIDLFPAAIDAVIGHGFRAWAGGAFICSLPVVLGFIWRAKRGAWMRAWLWHEENDRTMHVWPILVPILFARQYLCGLWQEGYQSPLRVNVWLVIVMMTFLGMAGSGIFIFENYLQQEFRDTWFDAVLLILWGLLSAAGWGFAITTAPHPGRMTIAAGIWLAVSMALAFRAAPL